MRVIQIAANRAWPFINGVEFQHPAGLEDAIRRLPESRTPSVLASAAIEYASTDVVYGESRGDVRVLYSSAEMMQQLKALDARVTGSGVEVAVFGSGKGGFVYRGLALATQHDDSRLRLVGLDDGQSMLFTPFTPGVNDEDEERVPFEVDPESIDRATRAHQQVCREIAVAAGLLGHKSVRLGRIPTDVAILTPSSASQTLAIVEVKTIQAENAVKQARLALGQILDYQEMVLELPEASQLRGVSAHIVLFGSSGEISRSIRHTCLRAGVGLFIARTLKDAFVFVESLPGPE